MVQRAPKKPVRRSSRSRTIPGRPGRDAEQIEERIQLFARRYRLRLRKMADRSPRYADLLFSCPAACIAIVTNRSAAGRRLDVRGLIQSAAPLDLIGRELEIPKWMFRLPPEAFPRPLPERLPGNCDDTDFGRRIVNAIPESDRQIGLWLQWLLEASEVCDEDFALWICSNAGWRRRKLSLKHLAALAAYAWYSEQAGTQAGRLIENKWSPMIGFFRALGETYVWFVRLLLDHCVDHQSRHGIWSQESCFDGIAFVPLMSATALTQEGEDMNNCMGRCLGQALHGSSRFYSLRTKGASIANLEICRDRNAQDKWRIREILGPRNKTVAIDMMRVAAAWLNAQNAAPCSVGNPVNSLPIDESAWRRIWHPYWQAKGARGIIAPNPEAGSLAGLMSVLRSSGGYRKF